MPGRGVIPSASRQRSAAVSRVEYELSPMGKTMLPALQGFTTWIRPNWPAMEASRHAYDIRTSGDA
jgi:DNA-binding HxlR family transcriptional regulator